MSEGGLPLISSADCGLLMPMHLRVSDTGEIRSVGPTLARLRPPEDLSGRPLLDVFAVRRPHGIGSFDALRQATARRLALRFRSAPETDFKGVMVPEVTGAGWLINLSFGISIVEAIRDYDLSARDFAPTDLATEMLYLIEAKSAILEEWRKLNARLRSAKLAAEIQAVTDKLTGLGNRRAFEQALERLIVEEAAFSVLQVDLDYFKQVNDTYGHAAGDHVLQVSARRMGEVVREGDTLTRLGGDEFALLLPGLVEPEALQGLAERIISRLKHPIRFRGSDCVISASVGIASRLPGCAMDAQELLSAADRALYRSKTHGRGVATVSHGPDQTDMPPLRPA